MRFQAPQLGALGVAFTTLRALQFFSLVAVIGLTANFVNEIVEVQREVPDVLIGTLTVASTAALYVAISYILYYDGLLPLLISAAMDLCLLVATIVVAATIGMPLSLLTCKALPESVPSAISSGISSSGISSSGITSSGISSSGITSSGITSSGITYRSVLGKAVNYLAFVATDRAHCYEIKAIWGLSIALCVLFAFSGIVCVGLWRRVKTATGAPKDIEG